MHRSPNAPYPRASAAVWLPFLMWLLGALAAVFAAAPGLAQTQQPVPALARRVTDLTGTLDGSVSTRVERKLAILQERTGAQIAVLILDSTQPDPIEAYAVRVFEAWKLGRRGVDDGVLLVVAKQDHKMRIEVGYGLEGSITDLKASHINRDIMAPAFRRGDFQDGIERAVDALIELVPGSGAPIIVSDAPPVPTPTRTVPAGHLSYEAFALLMAILMGVGAGPALAARPSRWIWLLPTIAVLCTMLAGNIDGDEWTSWLLALPMTVLTSGAISAALWHTWNKWHRLSPSAPAAPKRKAASKATRRPRRQQRSGSDYDNTSAAYVWETERDRSGSSGSYSSGSDSSYSSDSGSYSGDGGSSGGGGSSDSW
ncbi:TPM domain-containing protein [Ralstonia sp. R-29]|uniref:TPM domain-containing protein n=1 Tax=Ralstonia sp. R-29 TaxID=3404059 RepID=UPI003CE73BB3